MLMVVAHADIKCVLSIKKSSGVQSISETSFATPVLEFLLKERMIKVISHSIASFPTVTDSIL